MTSRCMVNPSGSQSVLLFYVCTGNALSSVMAQRALAVVVMADLVLHRCHRALLQHTHRALNNLCSASSLPSLFVKITESMGATLKMHMHILHHPRLLFLYLLMMLTQTSMNTGSKKNWSGLLYSLSCTLFNVTPNLVNSWKSTLLTSYDHHSSASKAPHMIVLST